MNRTAKRPKKTGNEFFETYCSCVLTLHNAPEWPLLRETLDLRLTELIKSTYGDIFPPKSLPSTIQRTQTGIYPQEVMAARRRRTHTGRGWTPDVGAGRPCRHNSEGYELLGGRSSPAELEGDSKDIGHCGNGPAQAGPKPTCIHRVYSNEASRGARVRRSLQVIQSLTRLLPESARPRRPSRLRELFRRTRLWNRWASARLGTRPLQFNLI